MDEKIGAKQDAKMNKNMDEKFGINHIQYIVQNWMQKMVQK